MSDLSTGYEAAKAQETAAFLRAHAIEDKSPDLLGCMQALKNIDKAVFDYCGKIEALMKAVRAVIDSSTETDASDALRHLVRLAEQRAALCREDVTAAVEGAGLTAVDEDSANI